MVATPEPRLNPFAFPSETDFRFLLLILAVAGASLFVFGDLYNTLHGADLSPGICALWMLTGSVLILTTAVALYWLLPLWKIKRWDLRQLEAETIPALPELHPYLMELAQTASLPRPPTFLWRASDQTKEGYAFGRWGDLYIYLPRGLIDEFTRNRAEFRAIVLHELAHIRNGDVHKTYLSYTVWWAFLGIAVPIFGVSLWLHSPGRMVSMGLRVIALFVLIFLTRNAVLRVREFYADVRASLWDTESSALRLAIEAARGKSPAKPLWEKIWLTHPNLRERSQVLQNPNPLFAFGFWEAFATGMAVMVPFTNLLAVMLFALVGSAEVSALFLALLLFLIPALVVAGLTVYILGVGLWRITFAALAQQKPVQGVGKLGLGLALGLLVGFPLSFLGASEYLNSPLLLMVWWGLLATALIPFLNWITLGAQAWFSLAIRSPSPRPYYRWGFGIATGLLACLFASLFGALMALVAGTSPLNIAVFNPLMVLALISIWAFPLVASFWPQSTTDPQPQSWLFLDPAHPPPSAWAVPKAALRGPLIIGLVFGLLAGGVLLLMQVGGWNSFGNVLRAAIVMQVVGGATATLLAKRSATLLGLFTTSVTGLVMVTGFIAMGGAINFQMGLFLIPGMLNSGGLCAIPVVLGVAWAMGHVRRVLSPRH